MGIYRTWSDGYVLVFFFFFLLKKNSFLPSRLVLIDAKLHGTGYPMAKNLRAHIPASDRLVILDINRDVMNQFTQETKNNSQATEGAQSAREVAEKAVSDQVFPYISEC